jgi:hypothetical protein
MTVRIPSASIWYTLSNSKFDVANGSVQASGDFGTAATASTTVTGYYNGVNGVLTSTVTVTASNAAPVVESVTANYDNTARRNGDIAVANDVVDVTAANFATLFENTSLFGYTTAGGDPGTLAPVYFTVDNQYGADFINKLIVTAKAGNTGAFTVNPTTGVITTTTGVQAGDEFTLTALAVNGVSKVVRIRIVQ